MTAAGKPRITWYVVVDGERFRRQATMRGQWSYEAACTCGWDTRTGGAVKRYITEKIEDHKLFDHEEN